MAVKAHNREGVGPAAGGVRILLPQDVDRLGLGWQHRHDPQDVRRLLGTWPDRSVWIPETREFALVGPWRNRPEIAAIQELSAIKGTEPLVSALIERSRLAGTTLVLIAELDERRRPSYYDRLGFDGLEEVITYELDRPSTQPPQVTAAAPLTFVPVSIADSAGLDAVLEIDHASFPWIWWNSALELRSYVVTPGVGLYLGVLHGQPVAYVGITNYPGWGHLDRIAILPRLQGYGLGRQALGFATSTLARRGARRIGLSTQIDNVRSQRLYERVGFRRSRVNDYRLYGKYLVRPTR